VRGVGRFWKDWVGDGLTPHTESLITALASSSIAWQNQK